MSWRHLLFLFCFVTFLFLIVLDGSDTIVKATEEEANGEYLKKKIFVQELDASNFLKKRAKRSARFTEEINDKTRLVRTEVEEGRDYYEERENEFWNFTEEDHDDRDNRRRERFAQWDE